MPTYDLSYLIRMGAGKHPQCRGSLFVDAHGSPLVHEPLTVDAVVGTCALGAAAVALSGLTGRPLWRSYDFIALQIGEHAVELPIPDWNDVEGLTREAIADRLDARPGGSPVVTVED